MEKVTPWYENMPAVYRAELDTLQHGLPYFKFLNQLPFEQTNGVLMVDGDLQIDEAKTQLIRITFPPSYPFFPPEVFPLQQAGANGSQAQFFNRGNQYVTGKMCLFREEEVWQPFVHGVGVALNQAKRWLEAVYSEAGFTESLIVEENNPVWDYTGQMLCSLPKDLPEAKAGKLLVKSFKENYYSLIQLQLETASEILVLNGVPDGTVLSPKQNEFILGSWFRVENVTAKELIPFLANPGNFINFLNQSFNITIDEILVNPTTEAKKAIVGFIVGKEKELHCFQINYWKAGASITFKAAYLLTKNLDAELFVRVDSLFNLNSLKEKKVLVVGLGAIGSEVVSELAGTGIGNFTVIDDETYEVGNSVRHAADLLHVGERKVVIAKKLIEGRNPFAKVKAIPFNIFQLPLHDLAALIQEADIILDLTANSLVEMYLHHKAFVEQKKTIVQAAVSKGGLTGIILAAVPGESACLKCLADAKLNYVPISVKNPDSLKDIPADYGACSKPAMPGSGLDTREVSLQAARVTLQLLLEKEDVFYPKIEGYQFYWHGPAGSKVKKGGRKRKPFEWEIQNFKPTETCENCKKNES